jgi:hypothetical protein
MGERELRNTRKARKGKPIDISRRRTPTFARPTWPAKNAMPSGQLGWAARGEVAGKLRLVPHREAIARFSFFFVSMP